MKADKALEYGMIAKFYLKIKLTSEEELECSFCGRKTRDKFINSWLDAHICDRCIEQAHGIVLEESKQNTNADCHLI